MSLKNMFRKAELGILTIVAGEPAGTRVAIIPYIDGVARPDLENVHNEDRLKELGYIQHQQTGVTGIPVIQYGRYKFIQ